MPALTLIGLTETSEPYSGHVLPVARGYAHVLLN